MDEAQVKALTDKGVTLDRNPRRLMTTVGEKAFAARG